MIKVYQTITDKGKGNCMQAAIASLFELRLEDVPNFIEFKIPNIVLLNFISEKGFSFDGILYNFGFKGEDIKHRTIDKLKDLNCDGINGCFYATVISPKYFNPYKEREQILHAVIIDKNYNIIHDPNIDNKNIKKYPHSEKLNYNGIVDVYIINRE